MKKIMAVLIAICIGMGVVNAQDTANFTIEDGQKIQKSDTMNLRFSTNLENVTTIHYKMDNGNENTEPFTIQLINIDLENYNNQAEHKLEIWATNNQGETSEHAILEFVMVRDQKVQDGGVELTLHNFPLNSKFSFSKVTDSEILKNLGTNYAYTMRFTSAGQSMDYYLNKYDQLKNKEAYKMYTTGILNLPSEITLTKDLQAVVINHQFQEVTSTFNIDTNRKIDLSLYWDNQDISSLDSGYIVFKDQVIKKDSNNTTSTVKNPKTGDSVLWLGVSASLLIGITIRCLKKYKLLRR